MRIGFDFDNTIVSYDILFHKIACEYNLIPADISINKLAVRNYLRQTGQEDRWTQIQGEVYGSRMNEAQVYNGAIDFICKARNAGHVLSIISHKTVYPFVGPQHNLHVAAMNWIRNHLSMNGEFFISVEHIFFELTKQDKIARIADFVCDIYIDDLPEILLARDFPILTQRLLFDPENYHLISDNTKIKHFVSWENIADYVFSL